MVVLKRMILLEHILGILFLLSVRGFCTQQPTTEDHRDPFRRLQSGENSGEIVNQCCKRETKFVTVGYGLGEETRVDVGHCRQQCETPVVKPLKREEFDKFLKKYPDMDPIQIFLSLQHHHSSPGGSDRAASLDDIPSSASCLSASCQPVSIRREKHFGLSGQEKEVDVIESCDCFTVPQTCQKVTHSIRVHPGTPFEKVVDIGRCVGGICGDPSGSAETGQFCRPIRNKTVSIDGPNGAQCMNVIEECQCVGECYRIREFFKVYDYTNVFEAMGNKTSSDEEQSSERINSTTDKVDSEADTEPLTKVIDIGRCSGSCSDTQVASKCLVWSSSNGTCLSALYGGQSKCSPTKFVSHAYMDKNGQRHSLISVTGCGCR